jgi:hypothetical protein
VKAQARPCKNCPWRLDATPGEFPIERYRQLASTAEDMSRVIFQCHKTSDEEPVACAGFLARGSLHNLSVRMAMISGQLDPRGRDGGLDLHPNYRSMAVAQGIPADDPSLARVRDDTAWEPLVELDMEDESP